MYKDCITYDNIIIDSMQQLQVILSNRQQDIIELKQSTILQLTQFTQRERLRIQKQNWIFKILKASRINSMNQKKIIYEHTIKMMRTYVQIQLEYLREEPQVDFTQNYLNLFVHFHNQYQDSTNNIGHLKNAIRPNNHYVVFDLLKGFLDIGRKHFKNAFFEASQNTEQKILTNILSDRKLIKKSIKMNKQPLIKQQQLSKIKIQIPLQDKINFQLFNKYLKFVDNIKIISINTRLNELYSELLQVNQYNNHIIHKFNQNCFGVRTKMTISTKGLYTKEEINRLMKQRQNNNQIRKQQLRQIKGKCSKQELEQHLKQKIQIQTLKYNPFDEYKPKQINKIFPLIVIHSKIKNKPLNLLIQICNKNDLLIQQFQLKMQKTLKDYLRQQIIIKRSQILNQKIKNENEYKLQNKNLYLDENKIRLISALHHNYQYFRIRKENVLPQLKQTKELNKINQIKSNKSINKLKQFNLRRTSSLEMKNILHKKSSQTAKEFTNKDKNNFRQKINLLIDKLIRNNKYCSN